MTVKTADKLLKYIRLSLVPTVLFVAVFLVSQLSQLYTFQFQEADGLFLLTPDYFRSVFSHSLPISRLLTDFQTQFYRFYYGAAFALALEAVALFLLLRLAISRMAGRLRFRGSFAAVCELVAAVIVAVVWYFTAVAPTTIPMVAAMLIMLPVAGLSLFFRRAECPVDAGDDVAPRPSRSAGLTWLLAGLSELVIAAAALMIAFSPTVRENEEWSSVKNGLVYRKWASVSQLITPAKVEKNHHLMPFVAMSLAENGKLGDRLFTYPVYDENDLDMIEEEDYYNSIFFRYLMYRNLSCPNEAIHNLFQLSVLEGHGTGFMVLRALVEEYYRVGDFDMVEKYCKVLDRSSLHGRFTKAYRTLVAAGIPAVDTSVEDRGTLPLIAHNPFLNIITLQTLGFDSPSAKDRILCTFLLLRDLDSFVKAFEMLQDQYPKIPRHYQEALALYGQEHFTKALPSFTPDDQVLDRLILFSSALAGGASLEDQMEAFGDTYWFYYHYME